MSPHISSWNPHDDEWGGVSAIGSPALQMGSEGSRMPWHLATFLELISGSISS